MHTPRVCIIGSVTGVLLLAGVACVVGWSYITGSFNDVSSLSSRRLYEGYATGPSGSPLDSSGSGRGSSGTSFGSGSNSEPKWFTFYIFGGSAWEILIYIIYGVVAVFFAWCYKENVVDNVPMLHQQMNTNNDDFEVGLCDCATIGQYGCFAFFCPYVRQAHTNAISGNCLGYWGTYGAYWVTGFPGCCCLAGFLTAYFRLHLKAHMGIRDNFLTDFCLAWLCMPCAIGQMAVAVDSLLGYEVECPFKVQRQDGTYLGEMDSAQRKQMMEEY